MTNSTILPPEWTRQSGVQLTWPHEDSDWADVLEEVEPVFVDIATAITKFEPLLVVARDAAHEQRIRAALDNAGARLDWVHFHHAPSNDTWARDHGAITVLKNGKPALLDFTFNGWGNKFDAALDNEITAALVREHAFEAIPVTRFDFVLEGGSIESDGHGTLLTTSECLLSPQRNPAFGKTEVETFLKQQFGLERILWLEHGYLAGDDTDSHIDTLARFTDAQTIAYVKCDDPQDEHYDALQKMESQLESFVDYTGKPYRLIPLPWPKARFDPDDRHRLPATYANFLIINDAVLVPTYDDENDARALAQLRICFPDREVIGLNCLPVIRQHGSLHCLTMQFPEGVIKA